MDQDIGPEAPADPAAAAFEALRREIASLGATLPAVVTRAAPEQWAWPEKSAARVLHRDIWSAGERMLATADPDRWRELQTAGRIVGWNRAAHAQCARTSQKAKPAKH